MARIFFGKTLLSLSMAAVVSACSPQPLSKAPGASNDNAQQIATVVVANPSDFDRAEQTLRLAFTDLGLSTEQAQTLVVLDGDKNIASQLIDHSGDGVKDSLLLQFALAATERKQLRVISDSARFNSQQLSKRTQAEISHKTGGQWQGAKYIGGQFQNVTELTPPPQYTDHSEWIRYEGPGIESDKVGYRIYLDWRNGFDVFGNKTGAPVLHQVGLDGYQSYHHMADWGMDLLKVGKSLGMGGYGFWNGKNVELVSQTDSRSATITNNGDIYSGFKINYNGWQVNNQKLDMTAHFAMNAGSRLVKVNLSKTERLPNMAIGLVKHPGTSLLQGNQETSGYAWTYVASWGKQSLSGENDHLGMAIIFRRDDRAQQTEDETSYVSVMKDKGGQLEYYFLAAWEHELDGVKTEAEFKAYLDREVLRLTKEPRVRYESTLSAEAKKKPLTADVALNWTKALADSELDRKTLNYHYQGWDENRRRPSKFEYDVVGLQIMALQALNEVSPDARYVDAAEKVTGSFIADDGHIHTFEPELFSIDLTKPGDVVMVLEQRTGEEKYRKAVDFLRENLKRHPRTSGGAFWHRSTYPNQLWLDGVYMGMPFLAQYAALYETGEQQHESFKEAVHEFVIAREQLHDRRYRCDKKCRSN